MYGIDWEAPFPPRRKRSKGGRPKGSKNKKPLNGQKVGGRRVKTGKPPGRPKGSKNSPEALARAAITRAANGNQNSSWRRRAPSKPKGGETVTMQSSSGFAGEADYSMHEVGRVFPRFSSWDREWNGWGRDEW